MISFLFDTGIPASLSPTPSPPGVSECERRQDVEVLIAIALIAGSDGIV
jgi:hypothetical protein